MDLFFGHIVNLLGDVLEKLVFRMNTKFLEHMLDKRLLEQVLPFRGQVMRGLEIEDDPKSNKKQAFDDLEKNDEVECRSAFKGRLRHGGRKSLRGSLCL